MTTFVLAALVLIMIPGPDQALITRNSLAGGRRGGLLTMVGGALGLTVHASAAALGLSALLLASARAFAVLKIVGAIYLLWLGVQTLRTAARTRRAAQEEQTPTAPRRPRAYVRQGFLANALNPKVALFFVTFLPQFLTGDAGSTRAEALVLSAIFAALYLSWFSLYVAAISRLVRWLLRPAIKSRIERVTGAVLLAVAARLALATQ
ncbi:LysE family translocator [Kribbella sp. NPDC026611]|uniref:LysE family translocator n=1 Tax=Kribbella sp. NPDC026611 TaxID=3154911 RepID=UPI0033D3F8A6